MTEPSAKETDGPDQSGTGLEEETKLRAARSKQLAELAAEAGLDKKAQQIEIIDVVGKVDYADYLVLMMGTSARHVSAIARGVDEDLSKGGHPPLASEGHGGGEWVLIDFFDIVVHVFSEDAHGLYDLSGLWLDASRVPLPEPPRKSLPPGKTDE